MRQTRGGFWPSEISNDCMTLSRCLPSKLCRGIVRSAFKKKDIIIQSSATYISWIDLALGIISLKGKTNKLKPDTLLHRRVSCAALSEILGFYDEFLYAKYPLKDGKIQEKSSRETRLRNTSHAKKETYNNSGVKRDFGF